MRIPNPAETPTVSVDEAVELLGVGRSTGYAGVKSGEIPSIRVGSRIRVPTAGLLRLLQLEVPARPADEGTDAVPNIPGAYSTLAPVGEPAGA